MPVAAVMAEKGSGTVEVGHFRRRDTLLRSGQTRAPDLSGDRARAPTTEGGCPNNFGVPSSWSPPTTCLTPQGNRRSARKAATDQRLADSRTATPGSVACISNRYRGYDDALVSTGWHPGRPMSRRPPAGDRRRRRAANRELVGCGGRHQENAAPSWKRVQFVWGWGADEGGRSWLLRGAQGERVRRSRRAAPVRHWLNYPGNWWR